MFDQVYAPMLHLVLQGTKELSIGEQVLGLAPATYFIVPAHVPAIGQVSPEKPGSPYLAMSLNLDPAVLAAILVGNEGSRFVDVVPGFSVSPATPELIDACLCIMRLIDRPAEVAMPAPMIEREILFRVLQGRQGDVLRQIAREESRLSQVRRAIDWIRTHYTSPSGGNPWLR